MDDCTDDAANEEDEDSGQDVPGHCGKNSWFHAKTDKTIRDYFVSCLMRSVERSSCCIASSRGGVASREASRNVSMRVMVIRIAQIHHSRRLAIVSVFGRSFIGLVEFVG